MVSRDLRASAYSLVTQKPGHPTSNVSNLYFVSPQIIEVELCRVPLVIRNDFKWQEVVGLWREHHAHDVADHIAEG